jgi:hypothetical protein
MRRTWLYHRTEPARIVEGDAQIAAHLATGWAESPAVFTSAPVVEPAPAPIPAPRLSRRSRKES